MAQCVLSGQVPAIAASSDSKIQGKAKKSPMTPVFGMTSEGLEAGEKKKRYKGYSSKSTWNIERGTAGKLLRIVLLSVLGQELPEKGLLVDLEWIDKILSGSKTWELRGEATKHRGPLGDSA